MKIAIYSDVHGNLPAFERMLADAGSCDQYICLGDLVNYGPWSNECVDLATSLPNSVLIMGNHETAFLKGHYNAANPLVQTFFKQTIADFKRLEVINSFVPEYLLNQYLCTHTVKDKYIYPDTDIVLDNNYIVGHSHHQFVYNNSGFTLYNAGSVGQNRKYINVINYLVYETEADQMELRAVTYDVDVLIDKMTEDKYPQACIDYYVNKQLA